MRNVVEYIEQNIVALMKLNVVCNLEWRLNAAWKWLWTGVDDTCDDESDQAK